MAVSVTLDLDGDARGMAEELGVHAGSLEAALEAAGADARAVWAAASRDLRGYVCDLIANRDYDLAGALEGSLADAGVDLDALGGERG